MTPTPLRRLSMAAITSAVIPLVTPPADALALQERPKNCANQPDADLARLHAPILRFAPGEQYFPTVPFFSAFDGVDNDTSKHVDLADPVEVAPLALADGGVKIRGVDGDRLLAWYRASFDSDSVPNLNALFYRVRCLSAFETDRLYHFLRGDRQAWRRFSMDRYKHLFTGGKQFLSLEYYMYYLNDTGLTGHNHDTEKLFLFMPADSDDARKLRIIVGAGHAPVTPNNILVLTDRLARQDAGTHAIVELGGHSIAPDLPPYGEFNRGWDANWYIGEDVWGTRDLQAIGGTGYSNDYVEEQDITRDTQYAVCLVPITVATEPIDPKERARAKTLCSSQSEPHLSPRIGVYALVADDVMRAAYLNRADTMEFESRYQSIVLLRTLLDGAWEVDASEAPAEDTRQALREQIGHWNQKVVAGGDSHIGVMDRIWGHETRAGWLSRLLVGARTAVRDGDEEYVLGPTAILKRGIYTPRSWFGTFETGLDVIPMQHLYIGVARGVPSVAGVKLGGVIHLQGGAKLGKRVGRDARILRPSIRVVYDAHYYRFVSWYLYAENFWERNSFEADTSRPDVQVADLATSLGVTIRPFRPLSRRSLAGIAAGYSFRLGLRANWHDWAMDLSRLQPEVSFVLTLRHPLY